MQVNLVSQNRYKTKIQQKFKIHLTKKNCEFVKFVYLFENCSIVGMQGIEIKGIFV